MHGKRSFEHGRYHCNGFPPNFKRPKFDAIRQFPRGCGALAPRIGERRTEGVSGVKAIGNLKVGGERAAVPVNRLSAISVRNDLKSETTELLLRNNVEAIERKMTPKNNVEIKLPKELEKGESMNVAGNGAQPKTQPLAKKYPPPKIRKGVPVFRQFPPLCGSLNYVSSSKSKVFAHESIAKHGPLVESMETNGNQVRGEFQEGYALERKLAGTAPEEFVDKILVEPSMGNEMCKQVQGGTSVECDLKQEEDRVEISTTHPLGSNLLPLGFKCQMLSNNVDGDKSLVGRIGKDLEKCSKDKDSWDESGMTIQPQGVESFDVVPSFGNYVISKQKGKWASNCELTEATFRYKGRKFIDAHKSKSVFLKNQDETENSEKCMGPLFDSNEKPGCKTNDLSIVPFDNYQAVVSRNKVREALDLFEEIFKNLSHQRKSKGQGKASGQVHVEAAIVLKRQQKWVNMSKQFLGPVPGVEVGDHFRFRVELVIVGLHRQFLAGIDFMKKDGKKFATSIVASGRYANEVELSDVLIYSGQGGNPLVGDKKPEDQKLERGNLALKNSMDAKTPVRVIRGCQTSKASSIMGRNGDRIEKIYIYDGLYMVSKYWQERGQYGKLVFMFQLNRIPGQPKIARDFLNKSKKSRVCKVLRVVDDISQGKEKMPIHAMNVIDDEKPPLFNYITNMIYPEWYNLPIPGGCDCTNGCSDSEKCSCAVKNGGEIPFNNNGSIIRAKPIVYECGPCCKCPPSCTNRVSQHGIRYQLEVFKTESRGWGVRSRNYISSGSFICEYVGELLQDKEAEQRTGNDEYLFDIGNDNDAHILQDEPIARTSFFEDKDNNGFTIDAARCGNIGRFINHSCSPNLYAQNVLYDHDEKKIPHIMLFASKNIPPLRELAYDYNYKVDQVRDVNGSIKKKSCYCGSRECTGRMY